MGDTDKDKTFYEMADAFIAKANTLSEDSDPGRVSATFLYAAARFNVFLVASTSPSEDAFVSRRQEIMDYFMAEYEKMLEEHFDDYTAHFAQYLER